VRAPGGTRRRAGGVDIRRIAVNTLGVSRRVFIVFAGTPCEEKATDRVVAVRRLG
jgi:hypothetical protein